MRDQKVLLRFRIIYLILIVCVAVRKNVKVRDRDIISFRIYMIRAILK